MSPREGCRHDLGPPVFAVVAVLALAGCNSSGDLGQLRQELVTDDIHAWVGRDAARGAGAPVSTNNLTDDERTLRDLAFPLIEAPFDRPRWDEVVYQYGLNHVFRRQWWVEAPTVYYTNLMSTYRRSSASRYNQLIDDIRNDIVRVGPFFAIAHRVVDLDRRRQASIEHIADVAPAERANAQARIGENSLTIAWVSSSLNARCVGYRFALEHLAVGEPEPVAAEADRALTQLQQLIAANQVVVAAPVFAGDPPPPAARQAALGK